jgi:hypothetical protein
MKDNKSNDLGPMLSAIFGKAANVRNGKVSVTTMSDVTPTQFTLLAQASFTLGTAPKILRSGTGVKVAFSITD